MRALSFICGVAGWLILALLVSFWAAMGVWLIGLSIAIIVQEETSRLHNLKGKQTQASNSNKGNRVT